MGTVGSVVNGVFTPWNVMTTGLRHALDTGIGFGVPGDRYNARDTYRTKYSASHRYGAGLGTAAGAVVPAVAIGSWARHGFRVGALSGLQRGVAVGAGVGALGLSSAIGVRKAKELISDDGHLGIVGSGAGIVGGFALGRRFGGVRGALITAGLATAGGIGGHVAARATEGIWDPAGDRNIGPDQHIANTTKSHDKLPGTAIDYSRGFFNNFTESGPTSQGISFTSWGSRKAFNEEFNKSEQAGAMAGDLTAAAILGGGALATGARIIRGSKAGRTGVLEGMVAANHIGSGIAGRLAIMRDASILRVKAPGGVRTAALGGMAALGAGALYSTVKGVADESGIEKGVIAGGSLAGIGAGAYAVGVRSGLGRTFGKAAPMANALGAVVLLSALSAARMPVQQFVNDAKGAWDKRTSPGLGTIAAAGVPGAAAGGLAGNVIGKSFASAGGKFAPIIRIAGPALGAALGAGAGVGISPVLPDAKSIGIGAAAGAAGLGLLAGGLTHNRSFTIGAATVGALGGVAASSTVEGGAAEQAE